MSPAARALLASLAAVLCASPLVSAAMGDRAALEGAQPTRDRTSRDGAQPILGRAALEAAPPIGDRGSIGDETATRERRARPGALWIDREALLARPTEGPAWRALLDAARAPASRPDLANQDDPSDVRLLARALVAVRTRDEGLRREVVAGLARVQGTERGASTLAIGRGLLAYVIAADLIELAGPDRDAFAAWLDRVRRASFRDRTLISTHEDRPNNWGTHAGASRIAIALYLGDEADLARGAHVFRGWLGEASGWQGFAFGDPAWQASIRGPHYGVNPPGATRAGHSIDGVLPDDQRRGGGFRWPPPRENYVYEALQGAVAQAVLLDRAGYAAFDWGDRALLRAFTWLHEEADYPARGDDTWLPHLINAAYDSDFPAPVPTRPGKGMGFSDWTHGPSPRPDEGSSRPDRGAKRDERAAVRAAKRDEGAAFRAAKRD